jgi:hypothetical protein
LVKDGFYDKNAMKYLNCLQLSLGKLPSETGGSPVPPIAGALPKITRVASEYFGWHGQPARSAGQLAQWKRSASIKRHRGHQLPLAPIRQ